MVMIDEQQDSNVLQEISYHKQDDSEYFYHKNKIA